jgi:hypothetical protein
VALEDGLVIGRKEILRPPPRTLALDHRIDGGIADPELPHFSPPGIIGISVAGAILGFKLRAQHACHAGIRGKNKLATGSPVL